MDIRKQLEGVLKDLGNDQKYAAIKKEGKALVEKMKSWDEDMVQRKSKAYDDVENFPNKFTANYIFLINEADSSIPRVNQPVRDRNEELLKEWSPLANRAKEIIEVDVPNFTKKLWEQGIGAIRIVN